MPTIPTTTYQLNLSGRLLSLDIPRIMGIVNCTPDSFYDGGHRTTTESTIAHALRMLSDGADVLDIGGQSTRPGATPIGPDEEWKRIATVIAGILQEQPGAIISVDTFHASVAARAFDAGALIINDVTAGTHDANMFDVVAQNRGALVIMHMQGNPSNMQKNPLYSDVVVEVFTWLNQRMRKARLAGVQDILLDVGFGFGKNLEHNFKLLNALAEFQCLGAPLLIGVSRKSMIWKPLQSTPEDALNGTTALHAWALDRGGHMLRTHDVLEAREAITLHCQLRANQTSPGVLFA